MPESLNINAITNGLNIFFLTNVLLQIYFRLSGDAHHFLVLTIHPAFSEANALVSGLLYYAQS